MLPQNTEGLVESDDENTAKNDKKQKKEPAFVDPFFQIVENSENIEKRVVDRDGKIPKLMKNIEKEKLERERKEKDRAEKQIEKEWGLRKNRPLKINANAYRADKQAGSKIVSSSKPNHQFL